MKLTRQQAIAANCRECICDEHELGTWVAQVEACTMVKCHLYEYRPVTEATRKSRLASEYEAATPEVRLKIEAKRLQGLAASAGRIGRRAN